MEIPDIFCEKCDIARSRLELLVVEDQDRQHRLQLREKWFHTVAADSYLFEILDEVSGIHFIIQDLREQIMYVSRGALDQLGIESEDQVVGMTEYESDLELFSATDITDDQRLIETGMPSRGRLELWFTRQGVPEWYSVTKLPIRSRNDTVIGILRILKQHQGQTGHLGEHDVLTRVIEYIRAHYARPITVAQLSDLVDLSPRQLERKFQSTFGLAPKQFVIRTRIGAACRALCQSQAALVQIAADCGFYDQSAFAQHFHHYMGMTPSKYRRSRQRKSK